MPRKRFNVEQIIQHLRSAPVAAVSAGKTIWLLLEIGDAGAVRADELGAAATGRLDAVDFLEAVDDRLGVGPGGGELIAGFDVRFSSPVFPGDTITTEMWQDGNVVSFRCRVRDRNAVVINGGRCTLRA